MAKQLKDFAKEILAQTGVQRTLCPVPSESLGRPAIRPKYTVLGTKKLQTLCPLRPWQEALRDFLAQKTFPDSPGRAERVEGN